MCEIHPMGECSLFRSKLVSDLALFIDRSLKFIKLSNFVRVGVRDDNVIRLKESLAGRRVEVLRV